MKMMWSVTRGNQRETSVLQRDLFGRSFHEFAIQDSLFGRKSARLFQHFRGNVDSNCFLNQTRDCQCGMPCSGGYIKRLITLGRLGEFQ